MVHRSCYSRGIRRMEMDRCMTCLIRGFVTKQVKYASLNQSYASRSFASAAGKSRKRKTLSLQRSNNNPQMKTTKDRLRLLAEKNQLEPAKSISNEINLLLNRAQSRVDYFRTSLYKYWNPEYGEHAASAGASSSRGEARPIKHGLIMDGRWWSWNIALALMPATLIFLYCEFRGKHIMQEFHQKQEMHKMKEIMGPEFVEQYERDILRKEQEQAESFWVRTSLQLSKMIEFFELAWQQMMKEGKTNESEEETLENERENMPKVQHHQPISNIQNRVSTQAISTPETSTLSQDALTLKKKDVSTDEEIQELIARIQRLEEMLGNKQTKAEEREMEQLGKQLQRVKQSGVQNRLEDSMGAKWRKQLEDKQSEKEPSESKFSLLPLNALENLQGYLVGVFGKSENQENEKNPKEISPAVNHMRNRESTNQPYASNTRILVETPDENKRDDSLAVPKTNVPDQKPDPALIEEDSAGSKPPKPWYRKIW